MPGSLPGPPTATTMRSTDAGTAPGCSIEWISRCMRLAHQRLAVACQVRNRWRCRCPAGTLPISGNRLRRLGKPEYRLCVVKNEHGAFVLLVLRGDAALSFEERDAKVGQRCERGSSATSASPASVRATPVSAVAKRPENNAHQRLRTIDQGAQPLVAVGGFRIVMPDRSRCSSTCAYTCRARLLEQGLSKQR